MNKIMPLLQDYVERAASILQKRYKEGKCTDIQNLYRCITVGQQAAPFLNARKTILIILLGRCDFYVFVWEYRRSPRPE